MKILIADFDKTLFTYDYKDNVKAINKFVDKGNKFIIATGRNLYSIKKDLLEDIKFSYLICNDGGVILDSNLNVIYRKDIIDEVVEPIFEMLKKSPYVGNPLIDLSNKYEENPVKNVNAIIARVIDRCETKKILAELLDKYPAITGYLSDNWLNIDDQSVGKGNALRNICNIMGYDYKKVYAIGDNLNDISMCEICNGFAVECASVELKDVCKGVVTDFKELVEML